MADPVVVGLIGVAAGAFANGGVQAAFASRDRRRRVRTSARIVFGHLYHSKQVIEESLELGAFWLDPLALSVDDWRERREDLAHLSAGEWWAVGGAFYQVEMAERARLFAMDRKPLDRKEQDEEDDSGDAEGDWFELYRDALEKALPVIAEALDVIVAHAFSGRERQAVEKEIGRGRQRSIR